MKRMVAALLCLLMLSACGGERKSAYKPYEEVLDGYTPEEAKADGCVVFEDSDITSGQEIWDAFLAQTEAGKSGMVRLVNHYSLPAPQGYAPELYEEMKDSYPIIYVQDLSFDGKVYSLFSIEDGEEYSRTYEVLSRFEEAARNDTLRYTSVLRYVLVHDEAVTWEAIVQGMFSSQSGAFVDHWTVYSDYAYKNE